MRKIVSFLSLALFLASTAQSQEKATELSHWMSRYYEHPQPELLAAWITETSSAGIFDNPNSRIRILFFASEVIKYSPDATNQLCKDISKLPQDLKAHLGWSFLNAHVPSAEACYRSTLDLSERDINRTESLARYDSLSKEPTSPADIEFLWITFFASGKEAPINKIIDALKKHTPNKAPNDIESMMFTNTAKLSLLSNIKLHNRVAEIAENRRTHESGPFEQELSELIKNARNQSANN